eukprot:1600964-Rhodomonas_salina.2
MASNGKVTSQESRGEMPQQSRDQRALTMGVVPEEIAEKTWYCSRSLLLKSSTELYVGVRYPLRSPADVGLYGMRLRKYPRAWYQHAPSQYQPQYAATRRREQPDLVTSPTS